MTPADYRRARLALGLDQGQLATLLGIPRETVCRRESGRQPISTEMAIAILALTTSPERGAGQVRDGLRTGLPAQTRTGDTILALTTTTKAKKTTTP